MVLLRNQARWRKTVVHALGAVVLSIILASLVAGIFPGPNDRRLGEAIGREAPWLFLSAALLSYGIQTRTRWMIAVGGLVTVIGVLGPAVALAAIARRAQPKLTAAEHAPLKLERSMACHPALPLTFGPVEGLVDDPEVASKMALKLDAGSAAVWSWKRLTKELIILPYFRGLSAQPDSYQNFVEGFRDGVVRSAALKVERETLSADAGVFRYELLGSLPSQAAFGALCRSLDEGADIRGIACIQTLASSNDALADVRESLVDKRCKS